MRRLAHMAMGILVASTATSVGLTQAAAAPGEPAQGAPSGGGRVGQTAGAKGAREPEPERNT